MKKLFLLIGIFAMIISCGGEKTNENEITLVFRGMAEVKSARIPGVGPDWDYIQDLVAEKMPGTTLKLMPIMAPEGEYFTKLALALKNDDAYDIVSEDSFMLESDVAAGLLEPLNVEGWEDWKKFYAGGREASTINGKVYTIPWNTDARGLWFNKDLIKRIGFNPETWQPKNWNEILSAARKIKAIGKVNGSDVIPFQANLSRVAGEATTMQTFLMLLYGTDDKLFENDKWIVESQGIIDTLRFLETLRKENLIVPNDILLTTAKAAYEDPILVKGGVGIKLDGTWMAGSFEPLGIANWRDVYGFTGMPTEKGNPERPLITFQGGFGYSISANSKKKEKAWEVIKIITSEDSLNRTYQISRHLATREDVGSSEEHKAIGVNGEAGRFLPYGFYRPAKEEYPTVSTEIQVLVESIMTGSTPENAMKTFSKNVTEIVGEDKIIKKSYK